MKADRESAICWASTSLTSRRKVSIIEVLEGKRISWRMCSRSKALLRLVRRVTTRSILPLCQALR